MCQDLKSFIKCKILSSKAKMGLASLFACPRTWLISSVVCVKSLNLNVESPLALYGVIWARWSLINLHLERGCWTICRSFPECLRSLMYVSLLKALEVNHWSGSSVAVYSCGSCWKRVPSGLQLDSLELCWCIFSTWLGSMQFRENVPAWACFHEREDVFPLFFNRVLTLKDQVCSSTSDEPAVILWYFGTS